MHILPNPQKMTILEGTWEIRYNTRIVLDSNCTDEMKYYAELLKKDIATYTGIECRITKRTDGKGDICIVCDATLDKEVYCLNVQKDGVRIAGNGNTEILYAIQTLRQMIRQEGACLPCLEIYDYPELKNRGYFYDATRGRVPTLAFLKSLADTLSYYKMNQLQLYVEHSFMFDNLSEVWRDDTPLTAEEILELDAYCRKLNIELIPYLSSFGHLYKVLSTHTYARLCELPDSDQQKFSFIDRMNHHTINATLEESQHFIQELLEEYLSLFTSNKFNLGADETFDLGKGRSKETAEKIGTDNLYVDFVNKIAGWLLAKGKQPMIWGDVIVKNASLTAKLPKELIYLTWGYAANQDDHEVKCLSEQGVEQYVCPGVSGWNQWINLLENSYSNIRNMTEYAYKYKATGILNTDWGDYGHINHPTHSIPGMIYGAVFAWNRNMDTFELLNKKISVVQYGDKTERFCSVVNEMSKKFVFGWNVAVIYKEMFDKNESEEDCRKYFIEHVGGLERISKANGELLQQEKELLKLTKEIASDSKDIIKSLLIAADGMRLMNLVGAEIWKKKYGAEGETYSGSVAEELEKWFLYYKELWREVSKESELYRVQQVIFWYADYLRTL